MKSLMDEAKEYAMRGFYVAAIKPKGKLKLKGNRYKEPTKDIKQIEKWWGLFPDANIGLPTGSRYNALIIIDIDVNESVNGIETIKNIEKTHGIYLQETSVARSGSGGLHLYYMAENGICCKSRKGVLPGIDIRSEFAHVVVPPSIHKNGEKYEWIIGGIDTMVIADHAVYKLAELGEEISK